MPYVYIGRRHNLVGKSLWEIVGSLKNYGVGRMVIKNKYKRYSEPCFMRITSAKPLMDEENLKGTIFVETVFRGEKKGEVNMSRVAYKPGYTLIPKHEEISYIKAAEEFKLKDVKIFAPTVEMPPLLKLIAEKKGHHATKFNMSIKGSSGRARIAAEGETPNCEVTPSLGKPVCEKLYEGVLS